MGRRLTAYVHVYDADGMPNQFGPSDDVPDWAAKLITNPRAWSESGAVSPAVDPAVGASVPAGNASRDEWAAYAASQGAPVAETVEDGLSRNDLRDKYGK